MSRIKPERAFATEKIRFSGIRTGDGAPVVGRSELKNLRPKEDGTVQKRCGYKSIAPIAYTLRGMWQGNIGNGFYCFAVAESEIYRIYPQTESYTSVGSLTGYSGNVGFFCYGGDLYLMDGTEILIFRPATNHFDRVVPYAPLYGYNWHPSLYGDVREPINLLTGRMRVHYLNTTASTEFSLPFFARSVDSVRSAGSDLPYTFSQFTDHVTVPSAASAASVEIAFTVDLNEDLRAEILSSTLSCLDRDQERETLFLYGGDDGYRVFVSSPVTSAMKNSCLAMYSAADPLYFRAEKVLSIGGSNTPVTGICRQYRRLLAFDTSDVWSIENDAENDRVTCYPLLSGVGCVAPGAVVCCDNDPIILRESGVYRLHSSSGTPDDFRITELSGEIRDLLTPAALRRSITFWDRAREEYWLRDPQDMTGTVYLWNQKQDKWFLYTNIRASFFFEWDSQPGFADSCTPYVFDPTRQTDGSGNCTAVYQSEYLSFGHPEAVKRGLRLSLSAMSGGGTFSVTAETESESKTYSFTGSVSTAPEHFDLRIPLNRFRFVRIRIQSANSADLRLYGLTLTTNQ